MRAFISLLILSVTIFYSYGHSREYQVDSSQENLVKFISDAPMEDFEGITSKIDGYIAWSGDNPAAESELYIEVDLNTLDTGIGLRNRHMRENYLETEKFPYTHFSGKITRADPVTAGELKVLAEGTMFIHGVEQPIQVEGSLKQTEAGYRIQANFTVKLTDYTIKVPKLMFFKIDENMKLELDFHVKAVE